LKDRECLIKAAGPHWIHLKGKSSCVVRYLRRRSGQSQGTTRSEDNHGF